MFLISAESDLWRKGSQVINSAKLRVASLPKKAFRSMGSTGYAPRGLWWGIWASRDDRVSRQTSGLHSGD